MSEARSAAGMLGLVGGDEFHPGNEEHDAAMVAAAGAGPAYVIATAAARQRPEQAVKAAQRWFARLGLDVEELVLRSRRDAASEEASTLASRAGFLYMCGGDPGLVASLLRDSPAGAAMVVAWRRGAVLAGSSAGAMALCAHVLVRESFPAHDRRRPVPGMAVVPNAAVLPHHDTFGERWLPTARAALGDAVLIGVDERTAAVWQAGTWRAMGSGAVTVHGPAGSVRHASGETVTGLPQPRHGDA